jgi:hypothetical protein
MATRSRRRIWSVVLSVQASLTALGLRGIDARQQTLLRGG